MNEKPDFKKVVQPGSITIGKRRAKIFVRIEVKDGNLSISGVEGPLASGNCRGSCGQIEMGIDDAYMWDFEASEKWSDIAFTDFIKVWRRWHLNNMRPGSPAQENYLHTNPIQEVTDSRYHFEQTCKYLANAGLNPDPETGYKYGSAWLKEELPDEVYNYLKDLPDSPIPCPWTSF